MMKYRVVKETEDLLGFEKRVTNRIEEGWKCTEGFFITLDKYGKTTYYQPMVSEGLEE